MKELLAERRAHGRPGRRASERNGPATGRGGVARPSPRRARSRGAPRRQRRPHAPSAAPTPSFAIAIRRQEQPPRRWLRRSQRNWPTRLVFDARSRSAMARPPEPLGARRAVADLRTLGTAAAVRAGAHRRRRAAGADQGLARQRVLRAARGRAVASGVRARPSRRPTIPSKPSIEDAVRRVLAAHDRRNRPPGRRSTPPSGSSAKRSTRSKHPDDLSPRFRSLRYPGSDAPDHQNLIRPQLDAVPDKPALEGLEEKWTPRWEPTRTYRVRSLRAARARLLDRHAAADGERIAARRSRLLVHAHRHHRALPADARQGRVLSDGLGRQRPADRAARAELLRRAVRSVAAVRPGVHAARPSRRSRRSSISRPNFVELCARLTRRGREGVRASVAASRPVGRLVADLRDDRPARAARVAAGVPAPARSAARRISSKRRRCGTSTSARRSRRPSSRIARCRARTTASASRTPTAPGAVEIDTTRPELIPACVALVAHPDDARYQPLFGREVVTPLFSVPVPVKAHPLADPEKGTGIAMICTFGDVTDVTWWRELSLPVRAIIQANGTLRPVTWGSAGWESRDAGGARSAHYDALAGLSASKARARIVETAARERRSDRRSAADHASREVLREGRSAARDRHEPPVVHQDDGACATRCSRAAASCSGIRRTCARGTRTG